MHLARNEVVVREGDGAFAKLALYRPCLGPHGRGCTRFHDIVFKHLAEKYKCIFLVRGESTGVQRIDEGCRGVLERDNLDVGRVCTRGVRSLAQGYWEVWPNFGSKVNNKFIKLRGIVIGFRPSVGRGFGDDTSGEAILEGGELGFIHDEDWLHAIRWIL